VYHGHHDVLGDAHIMSIEIQIIIWFVVFGIASYALWRPYFKGGARIVDKE